MYRGKLAVKLAVTLIWGGSMRKHACLAIATKFSHLLDLLQRRVDLESFGNGGTSFGTHPVGIKGAKTKGMQKLAVRNVSGVDQ